MEAVYYSSHELQSRECCARAPVLTDCMQGAGLLDPAWNPQQPAYPTISCATLPADVRVGARRDAALVGRIDQQKAHAAHRGTSNYLHAHDGFMMQACRQHRYAQSPGRTPAGSTTDWSATEHSIVSQC